MIGSCGAHPRHYSCGHRRRVRRAIVVGYGRNQPTRLADVPRDALGRPPILDAVDRCEYGHVVRVLIGPSDDAIVTWDERLGAAVVYEESGGR